MNGVPSPHAARQRRATSADLDRMAAEADRLAAAGELAAAVDWYRAVVLAEPGRADALVRLALVLDAAGRAPEAEALLAGALAEAPGWLEGRMALADLLAGQARWLEAEAAALAVLAAAPGHVDAELLAARAALALGRRHEAAARLVDLRDGRPLAPAELARLGELLHAAGLHDESVACFRAVRDGGDAPGVDNNLAEALRAAGRPFDALEVASALTERHPGYAPGWHARGAALLDNGELALAADCFRRSLALNPALPAARLSLARAERRLGHLSAAIAAFADAAHLLPDDPDVQFELGEALQKADRNEEALVAFLSSLRGRPDHAGCWSNLAISLGQLERPGEAVDAARRAAQLAGDDPLPHLVLARALILAKQLPAAAEATAAALRLRPDDTFVLMAAGRLLEGCRRHGEATGAYRRVLALEPAHPVAGSRLLDLTLAACDWRDYDALVDRARRSLADDGAPPIDTFNLQALPLDYETVARAARRQATRIAQAARAAAGGRRLGRVRSIRRRERIRIGYALAYTRYHSLPLVLKDLVAGHDRDRFEVYGYSIEPCDGTDFSRAYRAAFDHFRDVPIADALAAARTVQADDLDLLVDTPGLTSQNCMGLVSFRPALVQAHLLGYSITTGSDAVDYLVSDAASFPPELRRLNAEKTVCLPGSFMATVREPAGPPTTRAAHGLPPDAVVLANFNHPCKFGPASFGRWMAALRAVPEAVLWFGAWTDAVQDNLRREAEAQGVAGGRLLFGSIVDRPDHLARLALADLAVDCLEHCGGVTTVDALWAGLPVVTRRGTTPAARLGASLLAAAGLADTIVDDADAYVALVVALARDPARRVAMRARLEAGRATSALFDGARYRCGLEQAYAWMHARHLAGEAPAHYDVATDRVID